MPGNHQRERAPVLHLFRDFHMEVFCYPNPEDPAQVVLWITNVFLRNFLLLLLGLQRMSYRPSTSRCMIGKSCKMRAKLCRAWRSWVKQVLFTFCYFH